MKHLSIYERNTIETLFYKLNLPIREFANTIKRSSPTISRELKRNCSNNGFYNFKNANYKTSKRLLNKWFSLYSKYNEFTLKFLPLYNKRTWDIKTTIHLLKNNSMIWKCFITSSF